MQPKRAGGHADVSIVARAMLYYKVTGIRCRDEVIDLTGMQQRRFHEPSQQGACACTGDPMVAVKCAAGRIQGSCLKNGSSLYSSSN